MHFPKQVVLSSIALAITCSQAISQEERSILFTNVNVFDGVNEALIENANVVITDNLITSISSEPLTVANGVVIDGGGRTLMPGLIDAHWHTLYCCNPQSVIATGDILEVAVRGAIGSEGTLLRGFTTVRDVGGNSFAIKRMIDSGEIKGPRILPSGPPVTQTGGHFDYRPYQAVPTNSGDSQWYCV